MNMVRPVLGVHSVLSTETWLINISINKLKELLIHSTQAISAIHPIKNLQKLHRKMPTFQKWFRN